MGHTYNSFCFSTFPISNAVLTGDIKTVILSATHDSLYAYFPQGPLLKVKAKRGTVVVVVVKVVMMVLAATFMVDVVEAVDVTVGVGANLVVVFFAVCVIVVGMKVSTSLYHVTLECISGGTRRTDAI